MGERRYRVNEPSVISETIDGEVIVLNFENGHYFSLNPAGTYVWSQLARGCEVGEVAMALARRHGRDASEVGELVAGFVSRLASEALLRPAPEATDAAAASPPQDAPEGEFLAPEFEKFTDMEQLLLLDPIHEVADSGWPHERKP